MKTYNPLEETTRRFIWFLSELYGGNQFARSFMWAEIEKARALLDMVEEAK